MTRNKRPNLLLLFADQQRFDTVGAAGYPFMKTPNLDRLVREGCNCTRACTPNPVCIPARHNVLTGLPARFHGYATNQSNPFGHQLPTLPRLLSDHGYDTRAIGKMHFQPPRRHSGFDRMELMEEIPEFREDDDYLMYLKEVGCGNVLNIHGVRNLLYMTPQRSLLPEEHHGTAWVGRRAAEYIRANGGGRPFFLWAGWIAPHPPFDVPDSVADLYVGADLPEPRLSETTVHPLTKRLKQLCDLPSGRENVYLRRIRELYYAAVSHVDRAIGGILDALEEIGELDNTLIIHTSDHGELLGDYGAFQKSVPYDSCSRIPFIIRYPKVFPAGSLRSDFVDLNDILPTFLDAAGIEYPGPCVLPGRSLLRENETRDRQYMENGRGSNRWISMRDERFKFNYYFGGGGEELFDQENDPLESVNLLAGGAVEADTRSVRDRLYTELVKHEAVWGLEGMSDGHRLAVLPSPQSALRRNGQFPIFQNNLTNPREREEMNDFGDEVFQAVAAEPLVHLGELDLDAWLANGAPEALVEKARTHR